MEANDLVVLRDDADELGVAGALTVGDSPFQRLRGLLVPSVSTLTYQLHIQYCRQKDYSLRSHVVLK